MLLRLIALLAFGSIALTVSARPSSAAPSGVANVKAFGAIEDGQSHPLSSRFGSLDAARAVYPFVTSLTQETDWAALQAAVRATPFGMIEIPAGTLVIDTAVTMPAPNTACVRGAGRGTTTILQTDPTANGFLWNAGGASGGCLKDLTIRAKAPFYNAAGSSGIAVDFSNLNESFDYAADIRNFDIGIRCSNCFSAHFDSGTITYFQTYGIWIPVSKPGPTNDNRFRHFKIQNLGFVKADGSTPNTPAPLTSPPAPNSQIGVFIQQSGGNLWDDFDIIAAGSGLVVQPPRGAAAAYDAFTNFLADTSYYDNIVLDGSAGDIGTLRFTNAWGAYSTHGSGLLTEGAGIKGIIWVGGALRQNGEHGWDHRGGSGVDLTGVQITDNSKLATSTYDGVHIAAGVSNWSLVGGRIGNLDDGPPWLQRDNLHIDAVGSDHFKVVGVDLSNPGRDGLSLNNASSGSDIVLSGNTPVGQGLNAEQGQILYGSTLEPIAPAATTYLGVNGAQADERNTLFRVGQAGMVTRLKIATTTAAGASGTYHYSLRRNGADAAACSGTIAGATQTQLVIACHIPVRPLDSLTIGLSTNSEASPGAHSYLIQIDN